MQHEVITCEMRFAPLALLTLACLPTELAAQSRLLGRVLEVESGRPLRCIDAELLDSTGSILARAESARDGSFTFTVPDGALYRVRLHSWELTDETTEPDRAPARSDFEREYRVPLFVYPDQHRPDTTLDFIRPVRGFQGPEYPMDLRRRGIQGAAWLTFVVDPTGLVDTSSAFVLTASRVEFALSALQALPHLRFEPFVWTASTDCARYTQRFVYELRR